MRAEQPDTTVTTLADAPVRGQKAPVTTTLVRLLVSALGVFALIAGLVVGVSAPAHAAGSFSNESVADAMLRHVGEYGGAVCVEAGKSGFTGGAPLGSGNNNDGEGRAAVNCAVWIASGHTMWIGGGNGAFAALAANGVEQTWTSALKGDVIQWPDGTLLHTAVVVANLGGGSLDVVDSNFGVDHRVQHHTIAQSWRSGSRIFRLGTMTGGGAITEGSFVSYGGNVYRIAGGAPIYVSDWGVFGGPQPTRGLSDAEFADLRAVPADGTFIADAQTGTVYRVAGGAPIAVSD